MTSSSTIEIPTGNPMQFDFKMGTLTINDTASIYRGMTRTDLLSTGASWEVWIQNTEEAAAYRVTLPAFKKSDKEIILIAYFGEHDGPIHFWDFGPTRGMYGEQLRPNGEFTKRFRKWFRDNFLVKIPVGGNWGYFDAAYDYHNQTTSGFCSYRERFETEDEWRTFRKENRF